jgi:hypothetical protein
MTPTNTTTPTNTQTPTNTITATPTVTPTPTRSYYLYVVDAYDCNSGPTCTPSATSQILFDQNNSGILSNGSYYTDNGDTGGQVFNILSQYLGSSGPNYVTYVVHTPYGSCDAACSALFPPTPTPTPTQTPTPTNVPTSYSVDVYAGMSSSIPFGSNFYVYYQIDNNTVVLLAIKTTNTCEYLGTINVDPGSTLYLTILVGGADVEYQVNNLTDCNGGGTIYCGQVVPYSMIAYGGSYTRSLNPIISGGNYVQCP